MTDLLFLCLMAFSVYSGWQKGFARSLTGSLSVLLCLLFAWIYYQRLHNLTFSLGIMIAGPFLVRLGFLLMFDFFDKAGSPEGEDSVVIRDVMSRFFGAMFSCAWTLAVVTCFFMLLSVSILQNPVIQTLKENVVRSKSFEVLSAAVGDRLYYLNELRQIIESRDRITTTEEEERSIQSSKEFLALIGDPRLTALMSDGEIVQLIQDQDFEALMNNQKFMDLILDVNLMKKFLDFNKMLRSTQIPASLPKEDFVQ